MRLKLVLKLSYHSPEATWNDLEIAGLFLTACLTNAVASLLLEQVIKNGRCHEFISCGKIQTIFSYDYAALIVPTELIFTFPCDAMY